MHTNNYHEAKPPQAQQPFSCQNRVDVKDQAPPTLNRSHLQTITAIKKDRMPPICGRGHNVYFSSILVPQLDIP